MAARAGHRDRMSQRPASAERLFSLPIARISNGYQRPDQKIHNNSYKTTAYL
jgi:hypothetical protein